MNTKMLAFGAAIGVGVVMLIAAATAPYYPVLSVPMDTNGLVRFTNNAGQNFWQKNQLAIQEVISGAAATNVVWPKAGANVTATTNTGNTEVTISADVSHVEVAAAQTAAVAASSNLTVQVANTTSNAVLSAATASIHAGEGILSTISGGTNFISLYVAPAITSLTNDQNSVEIGATATTTTLGWSISGTITSQGLNQSIGAIAIGLRAFTNSDSYTTDRTYTLTNSDGTTTTTASTSVMFLHKAYWGVSANTSLTDGQVIALSSAFATSRLNSQSVSPSAQYVYFAYPASFGAAAFTVNGLANTAWTLVTRAFINASGNSTSYNIYRSDNLLTGTYAVAIQ